MSELDNHALTNSRSGNVLSDVVTKKIKQRFELVLAGFQDGQLCLTWPDGTSGNYGTRGAAPEHNASVVLHSYLPLRRLMTDGQLGFAESYMQEEWSTDNLPNLFSLIMRNEALITPVTKAGAFSRLVNIVNHWRRRNSVGGSQRNIAFHYDLGNEFYRLWLDQSMSYSSALYLSESETLEQAQQNKVDRVIEMLAPSAGSKVLEIGCGWGFLASELARKASAHVTGISLSAQQLEFANVNNKVEAIPAAVEQDRQTTQVQKSGTNAFEYQDYRDVEGKFDHIVSIEMFEAVGQQYWDTYFNKLATLLDTGGTAVIQTITILEDRFDAYRARPDFIQRYIFPGGMLPTKSLLSEHIEKAGFVVEQTHWFGESYARTLAAWRDKFEQSGSDVTALSFDERFIRMWRYYLVYCETGFDIGNTDVGLLKVRKV